MLWPFRAAFSAGQLTNNSLRLRPPRYRGAECSPRRNASVYTLCFHRTACIHSKGTCLDETQCGGKFTGNHQDVICYQGAECTGPAGSVRKMSYLLVSFFKASFSKGPAVVAAADRGTSRCQGAERMPAQDDHLPGTACSKWSPGGD